MLRRLLSTKDHYRVLGVAQTASKQEIKQAYHRMAKFLHPDVNARDPNAAVKFREAAEAYQVLGDDVKRRLYDARDEWSSPPVSRTARARRSARDDTTAMERMLGPGRVAMLLLFGIITLFFPGNNSNRRGDADVVVENCWFNPKTRRLEPPAPWDADYKAAAQAGLLRHVRKSQLAARK